MALAALGGAFMAAQPVMAQSQLSNLFANASPSVRDRMFMRLDYIRANVKTTAGDVQDVTGPVLAKGEIRRYLGSATLSPQLTNTQRRNYGTVSDTLNVAIDNDVALGYSCESNGLGTPCGVRAKSQTMIGTPALSLGYFLNDDFSWAVEAFVLAKPIDVTIQGDGANHLNGKDIIKLKMLPPTVMLQRYFGEKSDAVRPYVGFMASYAVFYDTKATEFLNSYQGGSSAGDTSISVKNTLGWGGMIGVKGDLTPDWHLAFSVGKMRYKTETSIVTRNTRITSESLVLQDYGPNAAIAVTTGASAAGGTTAIMCDLALAKYGNSTCNQGTFERKASNVLDTTLYVLSVGRSF
jgi:outer membrane protein W